MNPNNKEVVMSDCIFCKLANKEIPTEVVYENEDVFVFKDMEPMAKIHYLFIPKAHLESVQALDDFSIMGKLFAAIHEVAEKEGFAKEGYRVISNVGNNGNQSIHHLHIHVLAGEPIRFPGFDH